MRPQSDNLKKGKIMAYVNIFLLVSTMFSGSINAESVFGFKWKMSYLEANELNFGKMKKQVDLSVFNRTVYKIDKPKRPPDADNMSLWFFNGELYYLTVTFWFKDRFKFEDKMAGVVKFLESKHNQTEQSKEGKNGVFVWNFRYKNDTGGYFENPYNLEKVSVFGVKGGILDNMLQVSYSFYGAEKINEHIRKLKEEKEFGGF